MQFSDFSRRLEADGGILRLMDDLAEAPCGDSACMLGGGNPALIHEVEQVFRAEMQNIMQDARRFEDLVGKYDSPQGDAAFLDAMAQMLNRHYAWNLSADNIAVTNGSQSGFGVLFNLFAGRFNAGADARHKKILLPLTPEYIGYAGVGVGARELFTANKPRIELSQDELHFKYRMDFSQLQISDDIGALCVSRPTNPTGNVITDDEIQQLRAAASKAGAPLIIDAAYGMPFPNIVFSEAAPVWSEDIVLCLSLSKLGMPGARTGVIIARESIIEKIRAANAIFHLAPGSFGPALALALVQNQTLLQLCDEVIRPYYRKKSLAAIEHIRRAMRDLPVRVHQSEGAIFLWLWFENLPISNEDLYLRLKRRGVSVVSGGHFFPGLGAAAVRDWRHTRECIRVSYAAPSPQLARGIDIIAAEVRGLF